MILPASGDGGGPVIDGLVVVDKPAGCTSHDVVARIRRLAGTRRVGHGGTLDPMATGVLLVGIGRATRLLGHLAAADKSYTATVRLGASTTTDDAEGEVVEIKPAGAVSEAAIGSALARLTGPIEQVPPAFSAVKLAGRPAYARARAGERVELAARRVTVHRLELRELRRDGDSTELDLEVDCSTGTYIRAIARDLGVLLEVGGHLSALRRTRVAGFTLDAAHPLGAELSVLPLGEVVAATFPRVDVDEEAARLISHGVPLPPVGPGPVGVFGPDGAVLALVADRDGAARPLVVFAGSGTL